MAQPSAPGVIEVLDAPAAAGHAAGVLARLAERDQQRAAEAARRLEELAVSADPHESVDGFLEGFAAQRQALEAELQAAGGSCAGNGGSGSGKGGGDAAATLAALAERIAELEKSVADAAYFLPPYDLRQATLALQALREQQEGAAAALQPRKRFTFNRKASKASVPADASAAGEAQQQQDGALQRTGQQAAAGGAAEQQQQQQQALDGQQDSGTSDSITTAADSSTRISGLRGQVVALGREEVEGKEFTLNDLEDCSVFLLAPLAALFLHGLRRCKVYTGPVAGACFVEGAEDSVLMIAARQVRIHAAQRSDLYLRVRSHPIIEHSSSLRFAPYCPAYPGSGADLAAQGLAEDSGMWERVNDFGWLRATHSPHWAVLSEAERQAAPAQPAGSSGGSRDSGGSGNSGEEPKDS